MHGWDAFGQAWGRGVQAEQPREELWIPFPPEGRGSGQELRTNLIVGQGNSIWSRHGSKVLNLPWMGSVRKAGQQCLC